MYVRKGTKRYDVFYAKVSINLLKCLQTNLTYTLINRQIQLKAENIAILKNFSGINNSNIYWLEQQLDIAIKLRGFKLFIIAKDNKLLQFAEHILQKIYNRTNAQHIISQQQMQLIIQECTSTAEVAPSKLPLKSKSIKPRGNAQIEYVGNIGDNDVTFGIGPAGTGKTFLAVALAASALENGEVERIVLVRPAIEAGERLGFLPGDLEQKVNPYLRPLFDGLHYVFGYENVERMIEKRIIEIAPLAYMRGRTLANCFLIFDESQNSTCEQMKMLLTRIGHGTKVVVTGDLTQIDLPKTTKSGLLQAEQLLKNIKGIAFSYFSDKDVVRHPIVRKIISAYSN